MKAATGTASEHDRVSGEMISIDVDGAAMPAYLVRAESRGVPGVVILQEIFGVNAEIRRIADLVGTLGYSVVAPNVFHRTHPDLDVPYDADGIAAGRAAAGATTLDDLRADLHATVRYLRDACEAPRIATWGFCFGGSLAFLSATMSDVDAAVSFYGGQIADSAAPHRPPFLDLRDRLVAPLFFAFGGRDEHITAESVERIRHALSESGKIFLIENYPDEDHGFFRRGPDGDTTPGAKDVWPKVRAFLQKNLGA